MANWGEHNPQNDVQPPYQQQQQQQNPQNVVYPPQQQQNQQQQQESYQQQSQQQYQQGPQNQQNTPYFQGQQGQRLQIHPQVDSNNQQIDLYQVEQNKIKEANEQIACLKPLQEEFMKNIQIYSCVNIFFGVFAFAIFGYWLSLISLSSSNSVLLYAAGYLCWSLSAILSCLWYRENQKHKMGGIAQYLLGASLTILSTAYKLRDQVVVDANQKQIGLVELILDALILITLFGVSREYFDRKLFYILMFQIGIEQIPVEHRRDYVRHAKF